MVDPSRQDAQGGDESRAVADALSTDIVSIRRIGLLLLGLASVLWFLTSMHYIGWDRAKLVARKELLNDLKDRQADNRFYKSRAEDDQMIEVLEKDLSEIPAALEGRDFESPLFGLKVPESDAVLLLLGGLAIITLAFLLLICRLRNHLEALKQLRSGSAAAVRSASLLQLSAAGRATDGAGRQALLWLIVYIVGAASFAVWFEVSGLYRLSHEKWSELAFTRSYYWVIGPRLALEAVLLTVIVGLGVACLYQYFQIGRSTSGPKPTPNPGHQADG